MESVFFTNPTDFKKFKKTLKKFEKTKNVFKISRMTLRDRIYNFNCQILKQRVKEQMKKEEEKKKVKSSKYKYDK